MKVISNYECSLSFKYVYDEQICAKHVGIATVCNGDSGSPLLYFDNGNLPTVIGVHTYGFDCCSNTDPVAFIRVSKFVNWIEDLTRNVLLIAEDINH